MKNSYPIILTPEEKGFTVFIPDFNINTQGDDLTEAIEMARDAIGLLGIDLEDDGREIPNSKGLELTLQPGEFAAYVVVDFSEYRRKNEVRAVKKNCTIPSWLCYEAEKAGINFSGVLQAALKRELKLE